MNKIAILGVSGIGKDYFVDVLVEEFGYTRFSFSDSVKKLGEMIYSPWLKKDYKPEEKEIPLNIIVPETKEIITKTPREIWLSLNKLREIEDKLFIRILSQVINRTNVEKYAISDVRTKQEFEWCKENGFKFLYINGDPKHKENSFDDYVRSMKGNKEIDIEFFNNFLGKEEIMNFIKENIENSKE